MSVFDEIIDTFAATNAIILSLKLDNYK